MSNRAFTTRRSFRPACNSLRQKVRQSVNGTGKNFMKNVFHHLKPGGIFIFDFWNAPAVLKDPPRSRKKEMEDSVLRVVRTSYPTVDKEHRCVSVHFNIKVEEKRTKKHFAFEETHLMRYWHAEELVVQGETNGFRSLDNFRFLYTEPISDSDWNGLCIFQKP